MSNLGVPHAVEELFYSVLEVAKEPHEALAAALAKYNELLLGHEAMGAAAKAIMGETQKLPLERVAVTAAINSVLGRPER